MNKPITTLNELEEFVINVIYSIGNMTSNYEAEEAISKAFKEFKKSSTIEWNKMIDELNEKGL